MKQRLWIPAAILAVGALLAVVALSFASGDDDPPTVCCSPPIPTPSANLDSVLSTRVPSAPTQPASTATPLVSPPRDAPISSVVATATPVSQTPSQPAPSQAAPSQPPATVPAVPAASQVVPAPIDAAEVRVLESFPPQYVLGVKAGLPSGCARRHTHEVSRQGDTFTVRVLNTIPSGMVACTAIYGMYDVNVPLPGPFISGTTYTVQVNDKTVTFRAQ